MWWCYVVYIHLLNLNFDLFWIPRFFSNQIASNLSWKLLSFLDVVSFHRFSSVFPLKLNRLLKASFDCIIYECSAKHIVVVQKAIYCRFFSLSLVQSLVFENLMYANYIFNDTTFPFTIFCYCVVYWEPFYLVNIWGFILWKKWIFSVIKQHHFPSIDLLKEGWNNATIFKLKYLQAPQCSIKNKYVFVILELFKLSINYAPSSLKIVITKSLSTGHKYRYPVSTFFTLMS